MTSLLDQTALAELASQYGTLAQGYSNDYTAAQNLALAQSTPGAAFAPPSTTSQTSTRPCARACSATMARSRPS